MNELQLIKIIVTGRVQGVGFRRYVVNEARFLGIKGYVKNLSDGTVYIEAEGYPDILNKFVGLCRKGSGFSFVESVKIEECKPVFHSGFKIEY